ncbi:Vitamin B12 import system permease protein BtuC [Streptomyces tanashiensis]
MGTPVSAEKATKAALMPGRVSSRVRSRSKPTVGAFAGVVVMGPIVGGPPAQVFDLGAGYTQVSLTKPVLPRWVPMPAAFRTRRVLATSAALVALLLAVLLSLAVGARPIAPSTVLDALLHGATGDDAEVVRGLRVPRTLIGLMVGAALALAGTALQGITRNPIADPGILGISQGSSVAVVLAIAFLGVRGLGYVWFAFTDAGEAIAVYAIAAAGRGGATPVKLALGGAAVINALLLSVTTTASSPTRASALDEFRFWQIGSLDGRDTEIVGQIWPFLLLGAVLVLSVARGLDALALGEDVAKGLGRRVATVRIVGGLGATVLTGAAVTAAGPVAFVGLAVPHIARAVVGSDHRWVLPMAAITGPVMLLVADVAGRIVFPPGEIPAGVMTALIGVPFLVTLVRRKAVPTWRAREHPARRTRAGAPDRDPLPRPPPLRPSSPAACCCSWPRPASRISASGRSPSRPARSYGSSSASRRRPRSSSRSCANRGSSSPSPSAPPSASRAASSRPWPATRSPAPTSSASARAPGPSPSPR